MRDYIPKKAIALIVVITFAITGCATIIHGTRQDIRVTSSPSGAVVRVEGIATTTPGFLTLDRGKEYVLIFEKEGYKSVEVKLRKTLDGWLFGNIIIGGIPGIVIDFVTGSAYKLTPADVNVILGDKSGMHNGKKADILVFVDMEYLKEKGISISKENGM